MQETGDTLMAETDERIALEAARLIELERGLSEELQLDHTRQLVLEAQRLAREDERAKVVDRLRIIRDLGWQFDRIDPAFGKVEDLAEECLTIFGVDDRPYPNPRPRGWWNSRQLGEAK